MSSRRRRSTPRSAAPRRAVVGQDLRPGLAGRRHLGQLAAVRAVGLDGHLGGDDLVEQRSQPVDGEAQRTGDQDRAMPERPVLAHAADAGREALRDDQLREQFLGVLVDLLDRRVLVAPVEVPQEVAAVLAVHRQQAGRLGEGAQHVAKPLRAVEPARRQPRVALDDVAGDQRVLEVERGDVPIGRQHVAAQPVGAVDARLARRGLHAGVLHDRRQVDLVDVRRPVDERGSKQNVGLVDRRQLVPDARAGCRPGRSLRTRCRGRTARRTRAPVITSVCFSSSFADQSACLPRSGSACSTFSPWSSTVFARCQLLLHPAAAGKLHSGTTIG